MKTVTERQARKLIRGTKNVVVVHSKDECPVCQHFIPNILEPVFRKEKYKHITFVMIKEKLLFPVPAHPVTYFFRDGKNLTFSNGSAAEEAVMKMLDAFYR